MNSQLHWLAKDGVRSPDFPTALAETIWLYDFETAGRAVLHFLRQRIGFALWMVTRTEGEDWIVLQAEDHGYDIPAGSVLRWADSFCFEMVRGNGPRIAPDSDAVPAYAAAPIGREVPIKAYIGVPIVKPDGSLFGTLCAIDRTCKPIELVEEQQLIELLAGLLSTILQFELNAAEATRRSERLELEAQADPLTKLYNRRAWDQLLAKEEDRCRRYGHPGSVLVVDLDALKQVNDSCGHSAGDALILRTAEALRSAAREFDVVARLGGDEFGVLAVECDAAGGEALFDRVRAALAQVRVEASIGIGVRDPAHGLKAAWEAADRMMYREKRSR
jgi:diguanylate cyclase (GGDEF)-like protein